MAVPVARVHLKVAHAALPALLPTPPMSKMLPMMLPTPPCAAAILPKPKPLGKPGRADSLERWDAHKTKPAFLASSPSSSLDRSSADSVRSSVAGHGSSLCKNKNAASPPPMPGRADSAERWDAHKKRRPPQAEPLNDDESSSTGSNDIDDTEEIIPWKPRAMYAGPGFAAAVPEPSILPMPTAFLVPVA